MTPIAREFSDLDKTLRSGFRSCLTITAADTDEGSRVVSGWPDDRLREFAANWVARAEARQRFMDESVSRLNHLTAQVEEARRLALFEAKLAYESHHASTPGGCENCVVCGENWRSVLHLRSGESTEGRIEALWLTANPVRKEGE